MNALYKYYKEKKEELDKASDLPFDGEYNKVSSEIKDGILCSYKDEKLNKRQVRRLSSILELEIAI